jgi:predicted DNA-binding protein (UPF0251 family)
MAPRRTADHAGTYTYREAWERMGISRSTFFALKAQGRFDHLLAPVGHRISRAKLDEFLHGRQWASLRIAS